MALWMMVHRFIIYIAREVQTSGLRNGAFVITIFVQVIKNFRRNVTGRMDC